MLRVRWYKVLHDLWDNRIRTLIVALAIAVGVYAVGTVLAAQTILLREFHSDRADAVMASSIVFTDPFDSRLADSVANLPGVAAAEGRTSLNARVLDGETSREITLYAVDDFHEQAVDKFLLVEGRFPTRKDEILVEWMGLPWLGAQVGDQIAIRLSDDTRKTLTVVGAGHNPQLPSPEVLGWTTAMISLETLAYLGRPAHFDAVHVRVEDIAGAQDEAHVRAVTRAVEKQIERSGRAIYSTTITGESIIESIINTAVGILAAFGWIILLLSAFLVVNTVSALIAQQVNQIGIMKLVGAGRGQMAVMYITLVLVYGVIAFTIGIPLAVTTARFLISGLVEGMVNMRSDSYAVPLWIYAVMVAIGVLIPVAAGLLPVWQGTRISTYAALNDTGLQADAAGHGWSERLLARLPRRYVQRPLLLAVRNTLRHKGRLLRTMIVLLLGTALFIAVLSTQRSVGATQAGFLRYHRYDVALQLEQPQRPARIAAVAAQEPGVVEVEGWGLSSATRLRPDGGESNRIQAIGLPAGSTMVDPIVQAGRWLRPGDEFAVVVNATVADDEPDIAVGDEITLDMGGRKHAWTVVGVVTTDAQGGKLYMNEDAFAHAAHMVGKANSVQVRLSPEAAADPAAAEAALLRRFEDAGLDVRSTRTTKTLNDQNTLMFDMIIGFLILNAVLLGGVGSLGLSTTMGINMVERIREIGVLRAIGAGNGAIRKIVLLEGLVIANLSWAIGFLLSFPTARWMSAQIGIALLDMPLTYSYSLGAAILWYWALIALSVAASLGPAAGAVRLTIREVLAYE